VQVKHPAELGVCGHTLLNKSEMTELFQQYRHTLTHSHIHAHIHSHTNSRARMHARVRTHTQVLPPPPPSPLSLLRTHAHTRTHTHAHAHTRTRTHIRYNDLLNDPSIHHKHPYQEGDLVIIDNLAGVRVFKT